MILILNLSSLIYHFCLHTTILSSPFWLGPNFIELLKQKIFLNIFLVSRNEQDTSHKLYLWHGILAGNLFLISVILYTFCAGAALWTRAHWVLVQDVCINITKGSTALKLEYPISACLSLPRRQLVRVISFSLPCGTQKVSTRQGCSTKKFVYMKATKVLNKERTKMSPQGCEKHVHASSFRKLAQWTC